MFNRRFKASKELFDLTQIAAPLRVRDFLYSVNISVHYRYLYCETPKVASSTIKRTLQDLELAGLDRDENTIQSLYDRSRSPLLNPLQIPQFQQALADKRFFKFCFVRNPYGRLLSAYLDKFVADQDTRRRLLAKYRLRGELWKSEIHFKDFVRMVSRQHPYRMNPHWRPQVLQTFQRSIPYDFIGRLENFGRDFGSVLEHVGANPQAFEGVSVEATNAASRLAEHYDEETRALVHRTYRDDFDAFGYDTVLPA